MLSFRAAADSVGLDLPLADPEALEHSARVVECVGRHIDRAGGALLFDHYMEIVLYQPGLGYYTSGTQKFGSGGDFVTAPELGDLFGRCIARQLREVLCRLGGGSVLEIGPGTGALAAVVLGELMALNTPPDQYFLLEPSPELKARQQETLAARLGDYETPVQWLSSLPANFSGVVFANEVLDALPVTRFRVESGKALEASVETSEQGFDWSWQAAALDSPAAAIIERHRLPEGYTSECAPRAVAWVEAVAESLERGMLLVVDYGYPADEYYHPDRVAGTLMCHYRHWAHGDPFRLPGLQDITAHVDFSALAKAGRAAGFELAGFSNQEAFLLALGLTDLAEPGGNTESRVRISHEIQQLVLPSGMGERFKALALTKGIEGPLQGFTLCDRSAWL